MVRYLADRIAVMYLGRIMEVGDSETVFRGPNHPYTEALLSAVPSVDGEDRARIRLEGEIPSPANPPTGCVFHTRCHRFIAGLCEVTEPPLIEVEPGHLMSCHIPLEELRRLQRGMRPAGPRRVGTDRAGRLAGERLEQHRDELRRVRIERDEGVRLPAEATVRVHDGPPDGELAAGLDVDVDPAGR